MFILAQEMSRLVAVLVYRFLADLTPYEAWFGKFGQWLLEVNPADVRALRQAIQAPPDRT